MTRKSFFFALVLCIQSMLAPVVCNAFSIEVVTVSPAGPITPSDTVSLVVGITTPSQDAFLYAPTVFDQTGNVFTADIFIDDGRILPATDFLEETISLGVLPAGDYDFVVRLTAAYFVNFGVREVSGSFTVVPLPASVIFLFTGVASLLAAGRKRRNR